MPIGIYIRTEEHKKKMSKILKNRILSEEHRKKISKANKGRKLSEEWKKRISETNKGRKHTEEFKKRMRGSKNPAKRLEARKKISEACKGKKFSEEHKRNISKAKKGKIAWNKGKKGIYSKKTLQKISKAHKGKKLSKEHREKIGRGNKGKKISKELRKKMSDVRRAEKHPNWKGGITPENRKIRKGIETRLWRESVFARDGWACQKCKKRGGKLHSHHIQNFAQYPELRFAIDNGIIFCKNCHRIFHKIYGIKNNTKEQVEEFLEASKYNFIADSNNNCC